MASGTYFSRGVQSLGRRLLSARWLLLLMGCCCGPAWAASDLWVCPGNLFTNQLGVKEARERSCVLAEPSRLSQARGAEQESGTGPEQSSTQAPAGQVAANAQTSAPQPGVAKALSAEVGPVVKAAVANHPQSRQAVRDDDARAILQAELQRAQAQIRAFEALPQDSPNAAALHRLRGDEAALLREIVRLGR